MYKMASDSNVIELDDSRDSLPANSTVNPTPNAPDPPVCALSSGLLSHWKELEWELKCPLCREFFDAAVSLKCAHVFCSLCIRRHLELTTASCPSCRTPASASDFRADPVVAGVVKKLRLRNLRKHVRQQIRSGGVGVGVRVEVSKNSTFARQQSLEDATQRSASKTALTRTIQPMYKTIKDKDLREMLYTREGLWCASRWSRDEVVNNHKELIFMLQAATDGNKAGCYQVPIVREAIVELWTRTMIDKYGNESGSGIRTGGGGGIRSGGLSARSTSRENEDPVVRDAQAVQKATLGSIDFSAMRAKALANRKRLLGEMEHESSKKPNLDQ